MGRAIKFGVLLLGIAGLLVFLASLDSTKPIKVVEKPVNVHAS